LSGEISTKKHKMKVGFNTPQNPGFSMSAAVYPGGKTTAALSSELEGKFADCTLLDKAAEVAADPSIKSVNDFFHFYVQIKIKMAGDCSAQVAKFNEAFDKFEIPSPSPNSAKYLKIKCVQEGEYICIGTCFASPHAYKDFKSKSKNNDMQ
jgi:hypothetical protein